MRFARDMPAGHDMPVGRDMPFGREQTDKLQFEILYRSNPAKYPSASSRVRKVTTGLSGCFLIAIQTRKLPPEVGWEFCE